MKILKQIFIFFVLNNLVLFPNIFSMERKKNKKKIETKKKQAELQNLKKQSEEIAQKIHQIYIESVNAIKQINRANAIAVVAAEQAQKAFDKTQRILEFDEQQQNAFINKIKELKTDVEKNVLESQEAETSIKLNIEKAFNDLKKDFDNLTKKQFEEAIKTKMAEIDELQKRGIFDQEAKLKAQATIDAAIAAEKTKVKTLMEESVDNPKRAASLVAVASAIVAAFYSIKYSFSAIKNYYSKPRVITESFKKTWFSWFKKSPEVGFDDLIFKQSLEQELLELAFLIKNSQNNNANLPNILFYGPPGTGKTAFAKALAFNSGLDYALTTGSEFTKIKDSEIANKELRKFLNWAKKSKNGLIIFIDEAECLFANRQNPKTPHYIQDFINTFLSLVSDKSQKKLMFIFATNHPFKLDYAILDRIAYKIPFDLPQQYECEKILTMYLEKFAIEKNNAIVDIDPEVKEQLFSYAKYLVGYSPRSIKFVAEEMIAFARKPRVLTNDIVQAVINKFLQNQKNEEQWETNRDEWFLSSRQI